MEDIIIYLDNMFEALPETKEIKDLKEDLLSSMEDKYNELQSRGKSEKEALGIVISEFGNIDELIKEFDIKLDDKREAFSNITEDEVNDYLQANKKISAYIGLGVVLCIFGAALLILIPQLIADGFIVGISEGIIRFTPSFSIFAVGVGILTYAGMTIDKYKHIDNSFKLPNHIRKSIEYESNSFSRTYKVSVVIGVVLCILSPIPLLTIYNNAAIYGVVILMLIISAAAFIFIYYGLIEVSYKKLLKNEESYELMEKKNKGVFLVAAIVWPLSVFIYLISGIAYHQWHINWIIFPITGVLFGSLWWYIYD